MEVPRTGAMIILVVEGEAEVSSSAGSVELPRGGAAWVPADEPPRVLRAMGDGPVSAFVASVPE